MNSSPHWWTWHMTTVHTSFICTTLFNNLSLPSLLFDESVLLVAWTTLLIISAKMMFLLKFQDNVNTSCYVATCKSCIFIFCHQSTNTHVQVSCFYLDCFVNYCWHKLMLVNVIKMGVMECTSDEKWLTGSDKSITPSSRYIHLLHQKMWNEK